MVKGAGNPKSVVEELIGEKQRGMEAEKWMNLVTEKLREKEREMGPVNYHKYLEQISKELQALVEIENLVVGGKEKILLGGEEAAKKAAAETTTVTEPPQSSSSSWMSYSLQKLNEWRSTAGDIGSGLVAKVGEAFPPGTRSEQLLRWIEIATPAVVATGTVAMIYFGGGGGGGGGSGGEREETPKMMIAPGRNPMKIRRKDFEANTRGYFRELRGKP